MGQAIHKLTNNVNQSDKMNTPHKLLIIDDNKEILSALKDFFTRKSYEVFSAADGLEGLKILETEQHGFDLVITDMTMPKITGDRLARRLMDINPQIPVILCTGFNEAINEEKALAMGIDKFVMKPIVKNELADTIRAVLDNPKSLPN